MARPDTYPRNEARHSYQYGGVSRGRSPRAFVLHKSITFSCFDPCKCCTVFEIVAIATSDTTTGRPFLLRHGGRARTLFYDAPINKPAHKEDDDMLIFNLLITPACSTGANCLGCRPQAVIFCLFVATPLVDQRTD